MKTAIFFPGQGSQTPSMGQELYNNFSSARDVFDRVDETLGEKLSKIIFEGPADLLTLTENAQPALMAVGMAVIAVLRDEFSLPLDSFADYAAGHSLGEYTALTATSALSIEDATRLLRLRGQAMQQAVPVGIGAMAAILGPSFEEIEALILETSNQFGLCTIANDNTFGQTVLSGESNAVDKMIALAKAKGAKRIVKLEVSAPFHCALMEPAAEKMSEALANTIFNKPVIPVIANVTARPVDCLDDIRKNLEDQICGCVRWRETLLFMQDQGVESIVECGAGKVLCGLAKRISKTWSLTAIEDKETIEDFVKKMEDR